MTGGIRQLSFMQYPDPAAVWRDRVCAQSQTPPRPERSAERFAMLVLFVLLLLFVILRSIRLPDWLAVAGAIGATLALRSYVPSLDAGMSVERTATIVLTLVLVPYWLGPVVVYLTQRSSAAPAFTVYDPTRQVVPESITVAFQEAERSLVEAGFAKVGDFFQTGFMQSVTSRVTLFEKAATRQEAVSVGVYVSAEPARVIAHYVEVLARLKDGRALLVNNSPMAGAYAPVPGKTVEQFPGVRDPRRLARLHERLLARLGSRGSVREIDRGGDAAAYLGRAVVEELEQQIPTGYLQLDRASGTFRPTVKGAAVMTWRQLPPMSWIRRIRTRRRAAELVTSLGVTEPDATRAGVPSLQYRVAWPAVALLLMVMVYAANADTISTGTGERRPPVRFTVPAAFTVPADFPGAVKALETLTGTVAEQLTVIDSLGYPAMTSGATIGLQSDDAEALLLAAQPIFLERGFFLFRHEPNYGIGGSPDEIGLVPMRDQFEVVRLVGTNGANFDIATPAVIKWLRDLQTEAPFILTGIGYDHVEGRFLRPVGASADSLAERLYAFCPDVVNQGTGSVKELANEIGRLNTFFCWWD